MSDRIQSEWFAATLEDALETLEEAVRLLREDPRKAQGVLEHEVTLAYAKLNYAVNTAYDGPAALETVEDDNRSEERRVGKECRSRWSPYH